MKLKEKQILEGSGQANPLLETKTEVIKEVLAEVVQETERAKETEQKLLESEKVRSNISLIERCNRRIGEFQCYARIIRIPCNSRSSMFLVTD